MGFRVISSPSSAGGGSGDALTTNPLSQFAATTSAQLAGILSDKTGTGLAVFSTSPALTTPNLGTPSAINLANATGLKTINGASIIGAGDLTVSGTGDVVGQASSVDSEIALFSGTGGKTIKRASISGLAKLTSGVLSAAVAGTDYYNPSGTDVALADGGTGSSTAAGARTNLGLVIGTDVQAYHAKLAAIAGLTGTADTGLYFTGSNTFTTYALTSFGRSMGSAANAAAVLTLLGITTDGAALAADVNTGTSTTLAITPDALAGSNLGTFSMVVELYPPNTNVAVANLVNNVAIPAKVAGMDLISLYMYTDPLNMGSGGSATTVMINRRRAGTNQDILSTALTIDPGEEDTSTAAAAAVINTTYDDVSANDRYRFNVTAVPTTPPKGLWVVCNFRLP